MLKLDQSTDFYDMNSMTCSSQLFDPSVESDLMERNLQHNVGWKNLSSESQIVRLTSGEAPGAGAGGAGAGVGGAGGAGGGRSFYLCQVATLPAALRYCWLGSTRSSCTRSTVPASSSSPSAGSPSSSTPRSVYILYKGGRRGGGRSRIIV